MKRTVDMKEVASVLDSTSVAEYNVAIARKEDLWEVKRSIDEKIYFLFLIGLVTNEERLKLLDWSSQVYKQKSKTEEDFNLSVDF